MRIFLSTDDVSSIERAKQEFGPLLLLSDVGTMGHSAHVGKDEEVVVKTITDSIILSECDELIISQQSTFGALSAMLGGKLPLTVDIGFSMPPGVTVSPEFPCFLTSLEQGPGGALQDTFTW